MTHRFVENRLPPRRTPTEADRKAVRAFWRGWVFGIATSAVLNVIWNVLARVLS